MVSAPVDEDHDDEVRALREVGPPPPPPPKPRDEYAPKPPWAAEAEDAAAWAVAAAVRAGYSHSDPVTVKSANRAAQQVADDWEREHGRWDDVWREYAE